MEGASGNPHPDHVESSVGDGLADSVKKSTAVDGQGMWRSWTRVFAKPESACLDLLDNCFDAALAPDFEGKVVMEECLEGKSVLIQNNSETPIKKLEDALTVFKSSKNSTVEEHGKEAIGENGVGLKQGCAALSDCSVVLTRNERTVEIGIIAKQLQNPHAVYLPSFSFNLAKATTTLSQEQIQKWMSKNTDVSDCLADAFGPSLDVAHTLAELVQRMFSSDWESEEHVFLLVLCNLKKSVEVPHELIEGTNAVKVFLQEIKTLLPEHYVNLPSFKFVIDQERIDFSFWQRRLVDLTRFEVIVPLTEPFESLPEENWDEPGPNKYKLSIYCGFDAQRVDLDMRSGRGTSTCSLYFYSCQAGRLIKMEKDARHLLGLSSSGVDYTQGLTVIINDINHKLPLTPTKDDIAWSEQASGDIHRQNLLAWTGAVAHFYWTHHIRAVSNGKISGAKEKLKYKIQLFASNGQMAEPATVAVNLEDASFTMFNGLKWLRDKSKYGGHWTIRKNTKNAVPTKGPDTLFSLSEKRKKKPNAAKRKSISHPSNNSDDYDNNNNDDEVIATFEALKESARSYDSDECEELTGSREAIPWPEVDSKHLTRVTKGVLAYLRDLDGNELFELPVVETEPQLKDAYLQVVSQPMDFHTIENERMYNYTSTTQLQKDMILIFNNCKRFNGESSPFGTLAQLMLDSLDDAFECVITGKRSRKKRVRLYDDIVNQNVGVRPQTKQKPVPHGKKAPASARSTTQLQSQLKAERVKVKELQEKLAARDRRIYELETQLLHNGKKPSRRQNPTSATANHGKANGNCCQVCGKQQDPDLTLVCDGCNKDWHMYCLDPAVYIVPEDDWYCPTCAATEQVGEVLSNPSIEV